MHVIKNTVDIAVRIIFFISAILCLFII